MTPAKKDLGVELPVWAQVSDKRRGHIVRVTTLLAQWAEVIKNAKIPVLLFPPDFKGSI